MTEIWQFFCRKYSVKYSIEFLYFVDIPLTFVPKGPVDNFSLVLKFSDIRQQVIWVNAHQDLWRYTGSSSEVCLYC